MSREHDFAEFAAARMRPLYRAAWLLCGDAHRAEDLTQDTLAKVFAHTTPARTRATPTPGRRR